MEDDIQSDIPRVTQKTTEGYADGEKPLVFYYDRERRIANAPKVVRDYYSGKNKQVKGFFKVLVATPAKRMLFITIIGLCVIVVFLNYNMGSESVRTIAGIPVTLSAFAFEDVVYISIQLAENSVIKDEKTVDAVLSIFNADNHVLETRRLTKNYSGSEEFLRTTIADYDILRIEAVVTVDDGAAHENSPEPAAVKPLKTSVVRK
jgi:hypothetical protein